MKKGRSRNMKQFSQRSKGGINISFRSIFVEENEG